jgi:predicted enzyme related to lactoylglutathione lyase
MTRFVWYELMADAVDPAVAFYGDVVGWTTQPFDDSPDPYRLWVTGQGPIGGVMRLPDDARAMGARPHWTGYVAVSDLDATVAKVKELGGSLPVPPTSLPNVGRIAVMADAQGATLSLLEPMPNEQPMLPHDPTRHGEINWCELYADDAERAFDFYRALFGWRIVDTLDMGHAGPYLMWGEGDTMYGGMMTKTPDMTMRSFWLYYVHVDDLEAAIERATTRGARVLAGPMKVPGGSRIAQLVDPQGAAFALHGPGVG